MLLVAMGAMAACGPIRSSSALVDAASAVAAARTAGAAEGAPYELTAAESFLAKAREEQGYAEFETSIQLALRSSSCAKAALIRIQGALPPDPEVEPLPDPGCRPPRVGTATTAMDRPRPLGERFQPVKSEVPKSGAPAPASSRPASSDEDPAAPPSSAEPSRPEDKQP